MDTRHDCRRVQAAHDQASDAERKCEQPLDTAEDRVLRPDEDRPDDGEREVTCHEHADQRSDEEVQYLRHDLVQLFLDHREKPYRDHDRDDMSLIAHHVDVVEPEKYGLCLLYALGRHGVCILQSRVDHDHADDRAQIRVCPECLCR